MTFGAQRKMLCNIRRSPLVKTCQ